MGWQNYLEVVSRPRIFLSAWPQIDGTGSDDICRVDLLIGALEDTQINQVIGGEVISYRFYSCYLRRAIFQGFDVTAIWVSEDNALCPTANGVVFMSKSKTQPKLEIDVKYQQGVCYCGFIL